MSWRGRPGGGPSRCGPTRRASPVHDLSAAHTLKPVRGLTLSPSPVPSVHLGEPQGLQIRSQQVGRLTKDFPSRVAQPEPSPREAWLRRWGRLGHLHALLAAPRRGHAAGRRRAGLQLRRATFPSQN